MLYKPIHIFCCFQYVDLCPHVVVLNDELDPAIGRTGVGSTQFGRK